MVCEYNNLCIFVVHTGIIRRLPCVCISYDTYHKRIPKEFYIYFKLGNLSDGFLDFGLVWFLMNLGRSLSAHAKLISEEF